MIKMEILLAALSLVESGNNDRAIGGHGEVSRYQILRSVWREHRKRADWWDPGVSFEVAKKELEARVQVFKEAKGRDPEPREVMALWNCPGRFKKVEYEYLLLPVSVMKRCERYKNVVELLGRE